MKCNITENSENDRTVVHVEGALNIYNASESARTLLDLLIRRNRLTLDLSQVQEADTAGIQMLMFLKQEAARRNGQFTLLNHAPVVLNLLDLYGLAGFFGDPIELSDDDRERFAFAYGDGRAAR